MPIRRQKSLEIFLFLKIRKSVKVLTPHDHTDHSTFGEFFIITKVPNEGTVRDEVPSFVPSCVRSKQGTEGKKVTKVPSYQLRRYSGFQAAVDTPEIIIKKISRGRVVGVSVSEGREREISFVLWVVGIAESRRFGDFVVRALGLRSSSYFR